MASYHQASPQSGMMAHHRLPPGPLQANGAPAQHRPTGAPPPGNQQPSNPLDRLTSLNELTWIQIGRAAEQVGNNETAIFSYERALRFNQYSLDALHSIASVLRSEDKYDQAIQYLKTILHLDSHNGESWSNLGHCYLMMDELQEAYQAYQSALYNLRDPKEPKLWYGIGILYDRYGSLDHAEEAFSQVMRMAPDFDKATEIYFRLGIIYKQQAKFDQSLECFRWIADKPPQPLNRTDIWFQIGHVHEQQKDYAAAKDAYRRVLQNDPKHAKVLQQLGWLHHQESNDYHSQEKAIEYLEQSVNSDQTDAQSWYLLGRCYMSQQKFPKAYEAYQQAVYRDGRNPTFWCSIGVLYYQINQYRDALDAYSRAIRLNPNISEVWYDLGTLYESCNNQTSDALDAYQRAAELDPSNQHIKARLQYLRSGQGSGHPTQNGQPVDVHPQAYQPASVHGPPQPQWGAPGQPQAQAQQPAPPPLSASRDWPQRPEPMHGVPQPQPQSANPYEARDTSRSFQSSLHRQQSPRLEHIRQNDTPRHTPIRRPPSPSPRMRNALPQMYGASPAPSQAPPASGQSQAPPPSRISNPNYGQPLPPDPPQAQPTQSLQGSLAPYRATSPPIEVKPIVESRPRSPRTSGYPQHAPQHSSYQHHADPSGPSLIQGGYPAPVAAMAAAEAAARDRGERTTPSSATSKRVREWEDRDEGHNKKPASDEARAWLDDPSMRRPTPPALGSSERERDRDGVRVTMTASGSTMPLPGSLSPGAVRRAEDQRRANESYMPSQVAHQPQPLSTVMHQEGYQPPPQSASDAQPTPTAANVATPSTGTAHSGEQIRQETSANGEAPKANTSAAQLSEKVDRDGDVRMRTEEPAARKIDVDEDYDDDSTEETKNKDTNGTNSGMRSLPESQRASPRQSVVSVQNGGSGPTKIEA